MYIYIYTPRSSAHALLAFEGRAGGRLGGAALWDRAAAYPGAYLAHTPFCSGGAFWFPLVMAPVAYLSSAPYRCECHVKNKYSTSKKLGETDDKTLRENCRENCRDNCGGNLREQCVKHK